MKLYSIQDAIALCNTQVLTIDLILNERFMPQAYKQLKELNLLDLFEIKVQLNQNYNDFKKEYEKEIYFERSYLVFKQDKTNIDFCLGYQSHNTRYGYLIHTYQHYNNVSTYDKDKIETDLYKSNSIKSLNKVIKPTRKKLIELFENALTLHEALTIENNKNLDTINQFKTKILDIVKGLDKKDYYLNSTNINNPYSFTNGYITKVNHEYRFEISQNGYVTEKIIHTGKKDLETFLSL
jgi:hypothetical protein